MTEKRYCRRACARRLVPTVAVAAVLGGCGAGHHRPPPRHPPQPLVQDRAARPTDVHAHGISFATGVFTVFLNHARIRIGARDWNTITGASVVRRDVTATLDTDIHPDGATRARFQYLADRLVAAALPGFTPVSIATSPKGRDRASSIVALVNKDPHAELLSGLQVSFFAGSPPTTIAEAKFYLGHALYIRPHSIYFAFYSSPLLRRIPASRDVRHEGANLHYDRLYTCRKVSC